MTDTVHPVIYVDLLEDEPKSREEWLATATISAAELMAPGDPDEKVAAAYARYLDRFQPFRWRSKSEGNNEPLGYGERYFNEADAEHNIRLQFGEGSRVYLRRAEHGNELIRQTYPSPWGDTIVIGPECFAATDGSVINWRGVNYVPQVGA